MKTIIEMAHEAGIPFNKYDLVGCDSCERDIDDELERFATLVKAAHTAELLEGVEMPEPVYYWEPDGTIEWMGKDGSGFSTNTGPAHGWNITHYYTADQLRETVAAAVLREREECAKVCDAQINSAALSVIEKYRAGFIADAIRNRSEA